MGRERGIHVTTAYFLNLGFNGLVTGLMVSLLAMSITLVFGVARFPNASAGDIATAGAYGGLAGVFFGGGLIPILLISMAVSALLSVVFHYALFRPLSKKPPVSSLIASIGTAFFLRSAVTFAFGYQVRNYDLPITRATLLGPLRIMPNDIAIIAVSLLSLVVVFGTLYGTPIGKRMRAVADNPDLARVSGIRTDRVLVIVSVIAGLLAGLCGALDGVKTVVAPEMGWELLIPAFAAAILGGLGNPVGAVVGGILIGLAEELSTPFVGFTYKLAVGFIVLLITLLFRPQGIFSTHVRIR